MRGSKILCLACAGELVSYNLPVRCTRNGAHWTVLLSYVSCISCGTCVASADEIGVHTALYTLGEQPIDAVRGSLHRENQQVLYASDEEKRIAERDYWK